MLSSPPYGALCTKYRVFRYTHIYIYIYIYVSEHTRRKLDENSTKTRRMRWLGHLRRMPNGQLPKDILFSELRHGRRERGRPLLRFKDVAKRDLNDLGIDVTEWEHLAEDRLKWRSATKTGGERLENHWLRKLALQRQRRSTND